MVSHQNRVAIAVLALVFLAVAPSSSAAEVTIAVVGKYTSLPDAYKSLAEALVHGGIANNCKVNLAAAHIKFIFNVKSP